MDIAEFWPQGAPPLEEAKKYIEKYQDKKIILKYGGQVMASDQLSKAFAPRCCGLQKNWYQTFSNSWWWPSNSTKLKALNIQSKFILGLRVTDENVIKIVEEVYCTRSILI